MKLLWASNKSQLKTASLLCYAHSRLGNVRSRSQFEQKVNVNVCIKSFETFPFTFLSQFSGIKHATIECAKKLNQLTNQTLGFDKDIWVAFFTKHRNPNSLKLIVMEKLATVVCAQRDL